MTCQLEAGCDAAAIVRLSIRSKPAGGVAFVTVVPAPYGHGGTLACTDHTHNLIDGMLADALGPPVKPARETLDGPAA